MSLNLTAECVPLAPRAREFGWRIQRDADRSRIYRPARKFAAALARHPTSTLSTSPVGSLVPVKPILNKLVGWCFGVVFMQLCPRTLLQRLAVHIMKQTSPCSSRWECFHHFWLKPDFMHRLWSEIQIKSPGCFALAEAFFPFFFSDNAFSIQSLYPICLFLCAPSEVKPFWLTSHLTDKPRIYFSPQSLCLQYAGEEMWLKKTNFLSFLITFCHFANGNMAACPVFLGNMDGLVVKLLFSTRLKNICIFSHWVHGRRSVCACMQRAICVSFNSRKC